MTIAHDAQTRFPVTDGTDTTTGNRTFTHTPSGTPKGVVLVLLCGADVAGVTGVLYGGLTMTAVPAATASDTTEPGRVTIYTLDAGVPAGAQTVTLQGCTADAKWCMCSTVTAATSEVIVEEANTATSASGTNPQVNLSTSIATISYGGVHSGLAAPVSTVLSGCTHQEDQDYGAKCAMAMRRTSQDAAGTVTIGYTAAVEDYALAAVALGEFTPTDIEPNRRVLIRSQAVHRAASW